VGTLSDITERRRLDDDLHLVLNEAGDAIWIADENGHYLFANPSACRMTGHRNPDSANAPCRFAGAIQSGHAAGTLAGLAGPALHSL
jgi:PAS domain-containing protein